MMRGVLAQCRKMPRDSVATALGMTPAFRSLWQLGKESRKTVQKIEVTELLPLCAVKHFELGPQRLQR